MPCMCSLTRSPPVSPPARPACRHLARCAQGQAQPIWATPQHKLPQQQAVWEIPGAQPDRHRIVLRLQICIQVRHVVVSLGLPIGARRRPFPAREQELLPARWRLQGVIQALLDRETPVSRRTPREGPSNSSSAVCGQKHDETTASPQPKFCGFFEDHSEGNSMLQAMCRARA